jgi:integrase
MLKEDNIRKGFFEHDDFLALRDALPPYLKGIVTFAYKVGWRVSEIRGLTWSQVDLNQGIVRLEAGDTKNAEARTVYLDDELKQISRQQYAARKKQKKIIPYVFPNQEGNGKIGDFRGAWNAACKKAGIGKRVFHDFRRTAVRNMIRSGIPERVAMMISGHKTRSVFDRYNIVSDSDLKMAAQRQEEYLKSITVTKTVTIVDFEEKKGSSTTLNHSD